MANKIEQELGGVVLYTGSVGELNEGLEGKYAHHDFEKFHISRTFPEEPSGFAFEEIKKEIRQRGHAGLVNCHPYFSVDTREDSPKRCIGIVGRPIVRVF